VLRVIPGRNILARDKLEEPGNKASFLDFSDLECLGPSRKKYSLEFLGSFCFKTKGTKLSVKDRTLKYPGKPK